MSRENPSPSGIYSYWIEGSHYLEVDIQAAEFINSIYPSAPDAAKANRAFLRRSVQYIHNQGVNQFLDFGSGIPADNTIHEVVDDPHMRVVYVENDPGTVEQGQKILNGHEYINIIHGDLKAPESVLQHPVTQSTLDWSQPVAFLWLTTLNYVPNNDTARDIILTATQHAVEGSYVAISHGTNESIPEEIEAELQKLYETTNANAIKMRTRDEIRQLVSDFTLVEPGVVFTPEWKPDRDGDPLQDSPAVAVALGLVAVK